MRPTISPAPPAAPHDPEIAAIINEALAISDELHQETLPAHLEVALLSPLIIPGPHGAPIEVMSLAAGALAVLDFDPLPLAAWIGEFICVPGEVDGTRLALETMSLLERARDVAITNGGKDATATSVDLLVAMLESPTDSLLGARLVEAGLTVAEIRAATDPGDVKNLLPGIGPVSDLAKSLLQPAGSWENDVLALCDDLTAAAEADKLDPVVGRRAEIDRVLRILSRRTKSNVVLLGEPGVGKTAIAEGVAARLVAGDVPPALRGLRLLALPPAKLVAGATFRGDVEERVERFLTALRAPGAPKVALFIDELHMLAGGGRSKGDTSDVSDLLKPALARGELRCIGATTVSEWRTHVEADGALARRFEPVEVAEPSTDATLDILRGLAPRYAKHHGVTYTDPALRACVESAERHLPSRRFPDKAIDLLDESGAAVSAAGRGSVAVSDVKAIARERIGMTVARPAHAAPLLGDAASVARELSEGVTWARLAPTGSGPLGSAILVGAPGCGRRTLARRLACEHFGGRIVEIDLSGYTENHTISGLIGSPPGYVGYDEPARLVEPFRRAGGAVLLLCHVNAAAPAIQALIVELLRSGSITDASGRSGSFRDSVVLLTFDAERRTTLGFGDGSKAAKPVAEVPAALRAVVAATHELHGLDSSELVEVAMRHLEHVGKRLGRQLHANDEFRAALAAALTSGRPAADAEQLVERWLRPLANELTSGRGRARDLDYRAGRVHVQPRPRRRPAVVA